MKILQTIGGFTAESGGTSTCTYDLIRNINAIEPCVELLTPEATAGHRLMGVGEDWIKTVPNDNRTPYAISQNTKRFLKESNYDIYHANGIWMYSNHITCAIAREKHKPYIITPHGMLYPDALKRSYWKKWPLRVLHFNKDIMQATCIHATCKKEEEYIRQFGYKGHVAIIPNPCFIPDYAEELYAKKVNLFLGCSLPKNFGFLGRLHPIKKIENLLYGFKEVVREGNGAAQSCKLVVMGKGDAEYEQFLRSEVERLGLTESVKFLGFVSGREKYEALSELAALFVPSDFENFGMIVTEALICGTPVYASLGTPWDELNECHAGWWRDNNPATIAGVIKEILSFNNEELLEMGQNGRKLMEEKYEQHKVASMMKRLYEWIVIDKMVKDKRPEFVYE